MTTGTGNDIMKTSAASDFNFAFTIWWSDVDMKTGAVSSLGVEPVTPVLSPTELQQGLKATQSVIISGIDG